VSSGAGRRRTGVFFEATVNVFTVKTVTKQPLPAEAEDAAAEQRRRVS
jgi:hypothetical protein